MDAATAKSKVGEPRVDAPTDAEVLRSIALGYRLSQVLYVFAELRIADMLAAGPTPVATLAETAGVHPESLLRVLRAGRAIGLVEELPDASFQVTPRGRILQKDADESQWARVRAVGDPWHWGSWGNLLQTVTTGQSAFVQQYGLNSFEYFDRNPGAGDTMMDRVTTEAKLRGGAVADIVDFSSVGCIADVGGGRGAMMAEILARHTHLRGILFDLPYAVATAGSLLDEYGVADRCEIVAGDFRVDVPAGADIYLLSAVVHSWSDEESVDILRRCFTRVDRVLLLDEVVEPAEATLDALLKDLQLMVFSGGRQRGLAEYRRLLAAAGAEVQRVSPVGKREVLLDACPRRSR
jgi:hypothetical protein